MDQNELRRLLLFAAAVLALFFVARVYAPAFDAAFIWDDHTLVEGNASYRDASFGQIMTRPFWPDTAFTDARTPYFRPIVLLSYRFDMALGGTPREFHFTNIALHLVTCMLLGIVAVRAGASYPGAVIASLTWGALPRLTEAVAWIAGRTDVLAGCFGFAALALWPEIGPPPWPRAWARSGLAGLFLFLSFASKEVGVAFGIAIAVAVVLRKGGREVLVRTGVCLGVPIILYVTLRAAAFARIDVPPARELGFGTRAATVLEAAGRYAEATVDPFHPRTSIGMIGEPDSAHIVAGVIALIAGAGLTYYVARRGSFGARVGLVLGAAAIFPVLQIIPLVLTSAVVADRLLYVPLAGLALLLAVTLSHRGLRVIGGAAILLALTLGFATAARAADYANETRFWVIAAENSHPHNASPRMSLARWLLDSGEAEPACKLFEHAAAMLRAEGLSSRPPYRRAREGLASCWVRIGRYDDALRLNRELARELPNHARVALELGYAELHVRNFDAAAAAFARAASLENRPVEGFVVSPARIAEIQREDAAFDTLTPHERADHLAALGRASEASKAFLDVARNPELTEDERYDAATYLMFHGDYPDAAAAIAALPPPPLGWDMRAEHHWRRRVRVHENIKALGARIDALAR